MKKSNTARPINSKLNNLLRYQPQAVVLTSKWFNENNYSKQIISHYCARKWLRKLGNGAYVRLNENIKWPGAVFALQQELKLPVNVGGLTALELNGFAQNISFNQEQYHISLYNNTDKKNHLPKWFRETFSKHDYYQHRLFEDQLGLIEQKIEGIPIVISSTERAALEILDLVPNKFDYEHAKELIENLQLLRPDVMQELLEKCTSIKVKRLFLYFADTNQLPCFKYLNLAKLNLGRGKRVIGKGGMFVSKYQLSVPAPQGEEEGIGYV